MMPEIMESILNGMLYGGLVAIIFKESYHIELHGFDYFLTIIIVSLLAAGIFATISLNFPMGRFLTKFTFSNLLVIFLMEIFFNHFISLILQQTMVFIVAILLTFSSITFSVILGGLVLILNVSYLIKIGNIHRLVVNNFLSITTVPPFTDDSIFSISRTNYINYKISLHAVDYILIIVYLAFAVILTIRKEKYFFEHPILLNSDYLFSENENVDTFNCGVARRRRDNCIIGIRCADGATQFRIISRCRRHHYRSNIIHERSPLISNWLASEDADDDVFESPESNSRFIRRLSSTSRERLDAIQNWRSLD